MKDTKGRLVSFFFCQATNASERGLARVAKAAGFRDHTTSGKLLARCKKLRVLGRLDAALKHMLREPNTMRELTVTMRSRRCAEKKRRGRR